MKGTYLPAGLLGAFLLSACGLTAQTDHPTWATDIAPILYKNCVSCHRPGQIAPFELLTYDDAYDNRGSILEAVENREMPPWPPDRNYRHFVQERGLTDAEIQAIEHWVDDDAPPGDLSLTPPVPTFPQGNQFGPPDLKWQIPTYTVNMPPDGNDLYRCFVIHNDMTDTAFMRLMEVVPGNRSIVHHILVYQDTSGKGATADALDPEPGFTSLGPDGILIGEWVPGQKFLPTPDGLGFRLIPGSDIVIQVHYPQGSEGQVDSTYLNVYLTDQTPATGLRELATLSPLNYLFPSWLGWLTNSTIEPYPLFIPANQTAEFTAKYTVPVDVSVIGVGPHAHYINKSFDVFGVTPLGDIIPFIKIPKWEFHWQGFYYYPKPVKVPAGTVLFAKTVYDNTTANEENPFSPPQDVPAGEATTEEMLLVYFTFMLYQPGDENRVLYDSTIYTDTHQPPVSPALADGIRLTCLPNPASGMVQVACDLAEATDLVSLEVLDLHGRLMERRTLRQTGAKGRQVFSCDVGAYAEGSYFVRLTTGREVVTKAFVVLR